MCLRKRFKVQGLEVIGNCKSKLLAIKSLYKDYKTIPSWEPTSTTIHHFYCHPCKLLA